VPPRPKDAQDNEKTMFECPYCMITQIISSERKWK
jgi:hypothetical protein